MHPFYEPLPKNISTTTALFWPVLSPSYNSPLPTTHNTPNSQSTTRTHITHYQWVKHNQQSPIIARHNFRFWWQFQWHIHKFYSKWLPTMTLQTHQLKWNLAKKTTWLPTDLHIQQHLPTTSNGYRYRDRRWRYGHHKIITHCLSLQFCWFNIPLSFILYHCIITLCCCKY